MTSPTSPLPEGSLAPQDGQPDAHAVGGTSSAPTRNSPQAETSSDLRELRAQVARLNTLLTVGLSLLLVLTLCVVVWLGRLAQLQYRTIHAQRPLVEQILGMEGPRIQKALVEFERYGRFDTNFAARVLSRYRIVAEPPARQARD